MAHTYPPPEPAPLSVGSLARQLAARLDWEWECGALGVDLEAASRPLVAPPTAPPEPPTAPPEPPATTAAVPCDTLEDLRRHIGDCQRCGLATGRTQLVFGEGDPNAELVFVGEGPGRDEDLSGRPFVGKAGELLEKIIGAMGLRREAVYICNVVKCRPPENRVPTPDERVACRNFLDEQLRLLSPKIIVALGATAANALLGRDEPLSRLRGTFFDLGSAKVMPTYHPAYLLRNPAEKRAVWEDMQKVMTALGLRAATPKDHGGP